MSNHRNKKKSKHPRTKKHSTTQKKKNSPQNGSTRGQTGSAIKEKMRTLKHKTSMENLRGGKSKYDNQMRVRLKKSLNKESQRMFKKFSKIIPHKKTSKKKIQNIKTNTKRNKRKEKRNYKSKSTKEQEQEQQQQQQPSKNNLTRKTKILLSENNLFKLGQEEGNHEINGENKTKDRNNNKNNSKNKNKKKNYNEKSVNYKGSKLKKDQTHFVDLQNKNTKNQTKNNSSLLKNSKMELIQSEEQNDYPQNINSPLMDGLTVEEMISHTCLLGIPPIVLKRVDELRKLQIETTLLEHELQEKIRNLQFQYANKVQVILEKRSKIVKGNEKQEEETKGIPLFWLKVLLHHPITRNLIQEHDEFALKYLDDIQVELLKKDPGFSLHFFFSPNPYFEDKTLTKVYHLSEEIGLTHNLFLEKTEGTKIIWKQDKDLCVDIEEITKRSVSTGKCKTYRKYKPCKSFFNFFNGTQITEFDCENEIFEIQSQLEADFELGNIIKDTIIPLAVLYFSGEALSLEDILSNSSESSFSGSNTNSLVNSLSGSSSGSRSYYSYSSKSEND